MTPENHIGVLSEAVRKETTSSQTEISDEAQKIYGEHQIQMLEISDEEIEDVAWEKFITDSGRFGFISGAKWYREQLKKK